MWFWKRPSRLDRIEGSLERMEASIERLAEISEATNRRIDRFVETNNAQLQIHQERIDQLQRAVEYLLSKDR